MGKKWGMECGLFGEEMAKRVYEELKK